MGMDVYGKQPSNEAGEYFRASVWSWRPIHALCEAALKRSLPWGTNDGEGFKTQAECNELADKLEAMLKASLKRRFEYEINWDMKVNEGGLFGKGPGFTRNPYSTDREHVEQFIAFLRSCGGFKIC